jgi:choline dehydrogenase-like flavoprotein
MRQNQLPAQYCDYLIIGGGSAGGILAKRLADANIGSVILLEAGKSDEGDPAILDLSLLDSQEPDTEWGFKACPINGQSHYLKYLRARMLGGCGGHNDCAFLTPPDSDFDAWESLGAENWSAADVAPYFKRVKSTVHVDSSPPVSQVSEFFLQAGNELGLPRIDFTQDITRGVGAFPLNSIGKYRQSASVAYLHPLQNLPRNLRVECNTRAERLLIENGRVIGCTSRDQEFRANREVLLACGSIQTPQLLMVSGIGPGDHLSEFGIDTIVDLPGVGKNLVDHAAANVVLQLNQPIPDWVLTPCEVTMMLQVDTGQPAPELLYHFVLGLRDKYFGSVTDYSNINGVKLSPNVTRPKSRGELLLQSADIRDQPVINLNYFSDPDNYDMDTMIKGIRFAQRFSHATAFRKLSATEIFPGPDVASDEDIADYVRRTCETVYHPAGTCRMGRIDDVKTVVGPDLRIRGIPNLRVCDASVFPAMVTVNINNTVMMVAEKAADLVITNCG